MSIDVLIGILIPFVGTALGAACVFFLKNQIPALVQKGLLGFASGVMVAASVALDRKSTRLNSSHVKRSRMPSSA